MGAVLPLLAGIACENSTAPLEGPAFPAQLSVQESEGFYQGDDGYWYWNGEVPEGDASPATITFAEVGGQVPYPGNSSARFYANMRFDGDEGRNRINFTIAHTSSGQVIHSGDMDQEWGNDRGCGGLPDETVTCRPGSRHLTTGNLPTGYECGVRGSADGSHYARKAMPFGFSVTVVRRLSTGTTPRWGEAHLFTPTKVFDPRPCRLTVLGEPWIYTGNYATITIQDQTGTCGGAPVTWTSSDPTVAEVGDGWALGKKAGSVLITARCGNDPPAEGSYHLSVVAYVPPDACEAESEEDCYPADECEGDDCGEYEGECWECQQWIYYSCGPWYCDVWDEWECGEIDPSYCEEVADEEELAFDKPRAGVTLASGPRLCALTTEIT